MYKYRRNIINALVCFLIVVTLNFFLPRLLPGNPVAYLTGFAEENMTPAQISYYEDALHLNQPVFVQFGYYIRSLADGTLGYSYKKEAVVSNLIGERLGYTLQVTIPGVVFSTMIGLVLGMHCGYKKESLVDKLFTSLLIVLNTMPTFLICLLLIIFFCFKMQCFPYTGISSSGVFHSSLSYLLDRIYHLVLPVSSLILAVVPSRYLLVRNMVSREVDEKYILYAKERGISDHMIKFGYIFKNIAQPFIAMIGMSVNICIGGSMVIENIFSIGGMGTLLSEAIYTLDYPLMQGILFVSTFIMALSIIITDVICILIDPKVRFGEII